MHKGLEAGESGRCASALNTRVAGELPSIVKMSHGVRTPSAQPLPFLFAVPPLTSACAPVTRNRGPIQGRKRAPKVYIYNPTWVHEVANVMGKLRDPYGPANV